MCGIFMDVSSSMLEASSSATVISLSFCASSTSFIRSADAVALEVMVNILVIDIRAFNIIVKYVINAMILPISLVPSFTLYAPSTITTTKPAFIRKLMAGFIVDIINAAFFSFFVRSSFTDWNLPLSCSDFDSAFITLIPVAFSLTTLTMSSTAIWIFL